MRSQIAARVSGVATSSAVTNSDVGGSGVTTTSSSAITASARALKESAQMMSLARKRLICAASCSPATVASSASAVSWKVVFSPRSPFAR